MTAEESESNSPTAPATLLPNVMVNGTVIDDLSETVEKVKRTLAKIDELDEKYHPLTEVKDESVSTDTVGQLDKLLKQDRLLQWMEWCFMIDLLEQQTLDALEENDFHLCSSKFDDLCAVKTTLDHSQCQRLKERVEKSLELLHMKILKDIVSKFDPVLGKLNYPDCIVDEEIPIGSLSNDSECDEALRKFRTIFTMMLELSNIAKKTFPEGKLAPSSPNDFLLRPILKRFRFHFMGKKKTNNLFKPEWHLIQTRKWLKRTRTFYEQCVVDAKKPSSKELAHVHHAKFTEGLLKVVTFKLREDLEKIEGDDTVFSHYIDEILHFSKDINDLGFSKNIPEEKLPISLLTEETVLNKWLDLERKYAFETVDAILESESDGHWQRSPLNTEVFKCVETFFILLSSLKNRFKLLSSSDIHKVFLSLQCDLLDDFRMRLVQLLKGDKVLPFNELYGLALNSALLITDTLDSWNELPVYLHLSYLIGCKEDEGVFSGVIDSFKFIIKEAIQNIATGIVYEVKAQSLMYRKNVEWSSYEILYENSPCNESLGMFQALATNLNSAVSSLSSRLVKQLVDIIARDVSEFFLTEVIMENTFNKEGVIQLETDIFKGFVPILKHFSTDVQCPSLYLKDSIAILKMDLAKASLLLDSLQNCDSSNLQESKDILKELGIMNLSGSTVLRLLNQRQDVAFETL